VCADCCAAWRPEVSEHSVLTRDVDAHVVSLGRYDGALRRCVHAVKFQGNRDVAAALAATLARGVPLAWQVNVVCAVPLHPSRVAERGFNQAELLGRALAGALGCPYGPLLKRVRATRQQARLPGAERRANVRGAFAARPAVGYRILLVDDVFTTGATLLECAETLRRQGAQDVRYAVIAR